MGNEIAGQKGRGGSRDMEIHKLENEFVRIIPCVEGCFS
jgi:hypothetical protein